MTQDACIIDWKKALWDDCHRTPSILEENAYRSGWRDGHRYGGASARHTHDARLESKILPGGLDETG